MKSLIRTCVALLFLSAPLYAAHSVALTWTLSTDAGTQTDSVYRLSTTVTSASNCPTTGYTVVASGLTTGAYTDNAVQAGNYCYYVTATVNSVQSGPSNFVLAQVPVAPPTGLSIQSVAELMAPNGKSEAIQASWTDPSSSVGTSFTLFTSAGTLKSGTRPPSQGTENLTWTGAPQSLPISLTVCDTAGNCQTQAAVLSSGKKAVTGT